MPTIKCPKCGWEYHVSEIFYPYSLTGKASNIVRSEEGKILYMNCEEPELEETFCCENCDHEFTVKAKVTFEVVEEKEDEFVDEF